MNQSLEFYTQNVAECSNSMVKGGCRQYDEMESFEVVFARSVKPMLVMLGHFRLILNPKRMCHLIYLQYCVQILRG